MNDFHFRLRRPLPSIPVVSLLSCLLTISAASDAAEVEPVAEDSHPRIVVPFLKATCFDCHAGDNPDSGVSLDTLLGADTNQHRALWEAALKQLKAGAMPPDDVARPDEQEVAAVTRWIDSELYSVDCDAETDSGRVTIRRLNRAEYGNTIRDLLGVEFAPTENFPADELGYGYDNNGDALTVSPLLMEKYLNAAEEISRSAMPAEEDIELPLINITADKLEGGSRRDGARILTSHGEITAKWRNEQPGTYKLRIKAFSDPAGDEPARMEVVVDGRIVTEFAVPVAHDNPQWYTLRLPLEEGHRRLGMLFTNDFYDPGNGDRPKRDRNLWVAEVQVIGPVLPPREPSAFYRSLQERLPHVERPPKTKEQREALINTTRSIIQDLLRRAFRRPAESDKVERLSEFVVSKVESGDSYRKALQRALQVVLISPEFLFRDETVVEQSETKSKAMLDEFALASRLSYFLWSSMPDDELLRLAAENRLQAQLAPQVRRMLADDKSQALVENFAGQWLDTRQLQTRQPDPEQFDVYDDSLADAMRDETLHFFAGILRNDRPLFDLLDADYTYLNERLAKHYGIEGVEGDHFRRVSLKDRHRGGVVTQASMLTLTSNPTRTSPVKRGKWIMEQILGDAPPPPPANVPELEEQEELTGTLRERLEQHRTNQVCASCHQTMDPLGFALEHFDAVGRWREHDGEQKIDAVGELPDGTKFDGPVGLKQLLMQRKNEFRTAFARQLLTYALGRGLEYYDACAVEQICEKTEQNDDTLAAMIIAIINSEPFQFRRLDSSGEEGATR